MLSRFVALLLFSFLFLTAFAADSQKLGTTNIAVTLDALTDRHPISSNMFMVERIRKMSRPSQIAA